MPRPNQSRLVTGTNCFSVNDSKTWMRSSNILLMPWKVHLIGLSFRALFLTLALLAIGISLKLSTRRWNTKSKYIKMRIFRCNFDKRWRCFSKKGTNSMLTSQEGNSRILTRKLSKLRTQIHQLRSSCAWSSRSWWFRQKPTGKQTSRSCMSW